MPLRYIKHIPERCSAGWPIAGCGVRPPSLSFARLVCPAALIALGLHVRACPFQAFELCSAWRARLGAWPIRLSYAPWPACLGGRCPSGLAFQRKSVRALLRCRRSCGGASSGGSRSPFLRCVRGSWRAATCARPAYFPNVLRTPYSGEHERQKCGTTRKVRDDEK